MCVCVSMRVRVTCVRRGGFLRRNGRTVSNVPIFRTRDLEEETPSRLKRKESARMKRTSLSLSLFFFLRREDVKVFKACVCACESTRVFLQFFLNADVG